MGLEAVKEEIIRNAKEQETALIAEARKEANRIVRETEKKIEEIREKSEADTKKMLDTIKRQEIASAELESKKMALEAKKEAIGNVFSEAKKKLEGMDDKKRELCIKHLIEKTKKEIEVANIYCNKRDAKFLKGFNVQAIDIAGGLIAENKEKTIRVDYSFEILLESIKETELQSASKILFG
ncbi:hypothetical protein HYT53_04260 [Candidatus Woesearchaeota archaeon]|nr:hypothetical protein [Candidatus Woesearchaeota archaeon]